MQRLVERWNGGSRRSRLLYGRLAGIASLRRSGDWARFTRGAP
jgi:hypothetical protein